MNEFERESFHADFERALAFATRLHGPQTRKETDIPYISHLIGVAGLVLENGGDRDQAIAGLLHDAEGASKSAYRERRERYVAHLEEAPPEVLLVSCADKLHNARAIVADLRVMGNALFDRFNGGREGTLWYYESLAG